MTPDELSRYRRQMILPEVGRAGQERLREAAVLVVGAGGLGSPVAIYLAAAGVGRIGLVDFDAVDASNLHRQILYSTADVGRDKLEAARDRLTAINPFITVEIHSVRLAPDNADEILERYDVVLDGTDNFPTRYLVNDTCVRLGIPNVSASLDRFSGQVSVFGARTETGPGPCYRCVFPEPPPPGAVLSCAEGGVLGVLPGLIGTIQATETLKLILGIGESLVGKLLTADALTMQFRTLRVARDPDCPVCGDRPNPPPPLDFDLYCSPTPNPMSVPEITVRDLKDRLDAGERPFILDVRGEDEYAIAHLDGTLIPLGELPNRVEEIASHREDELVVVHCRSGARSAKAVEILQQHGFTNAVNLKGGVLAWSDQIDPSMPKY